MRREGGPDDSPQPRERSLEDLYVRHAPGAPRARVLADRQPRARRGRRPGCLHPGRRPIPPPARIPTRSPPTSARPMVNRCMSHHRRAKTGAHVRRTRVVAEQRAISPEQPDLATRDELRVERSARSRMRQRAAIVLRYYEDLSERAADDVMACSAGAAQPTRRPWDVDAPHADRRGRPMNDHDLQEMFRRRESSMS